MIRVMVVEDHDLVRSAMCELIDSAGDMQVVGQAENGAEALPTARTTAPEVVLMDLSMPVMNGIDATRELVSALPDVRVIVLTTSTRGRDVQDAAAAGAFGFIFKGSDPEAVLGAIRSVSTGGTAWDRRAAEILREVK